MCTTGNYDRSDNNDYTESVLGASSDEDNELMATTSTRGRRRKGKNSKEKTINKKGKDDDGEKKQKRMTARTAKSLDVRAPTRTPHTINVSGTKDTKDGVPARSAMNWKLISNPGRSSVPNWEDDLNRMNDGVGGQQKRRMIRKKDGL